jgi:hypothetical protein
MRLLDIITSLWLISFSLVQVSEAQNTNAHNNLIITTSKYKVKLGFSEDGVLPQDMPPEEIPEEEEEELPGVVEIADGVILVDGDKPVVLNVYMQKV